MSETVGTTAVPDAAVLPDAAPVPEATATAAVGFASGVHRRLDLTPIATEGR